MCPSHCPAAELRRTWSFSIRTHCDLGLEHIGRQEKERHDWVNYCDRESLGLFKSWRSLRRSPAAAAESQNKSINCTRQTGTSSERVAGLECCTSTKRHREKQTMLEQYGRLRPAPFATRNFPSAQRPPSSTWGCATGVRLSTWVAAAWQHCSMALINVPLTRHSACFAPLAAMLDPGSSGRRPNSKRTPG